MKNSKGFSLAELSVTLIVIGLIVAGITSGGHLIQAAKLNNVIAEISSYGEAVEDFKLKYRAFPGDMANAENFWGTYHVTDNPTGTINGNGNEQISTAGETFRAWHHLSISESIAGNYTGLDNGTPDWEPGINTPASGLEPRQYLMGYTGDIFDTAGNLIQLTQNASSNGYSASITPADAYLIDKKIDDGAASTGDIFAIRGSDFTGSAGACVDDDFTAASASYILTDDSVSCRLILWLNN